MTTYFLEPPGRLLDAAKQAAIDAVAGYANLNPYTIGIAVQAAASVLRTDAHPPSNRVHPESWSPRDPVDSTPRLRALESVADAARLAHNGFGHTTAEPCGLCGALRELEQAG